VAAAATLKSVPSTSMLLDDIVPGCGSVKVDSGVELVFSKLGNSVRDAVRD
jgi:hypothetical protein